MKKFQSWVKGIFLTTLFICSIGICEAQERFDFEVHQGHFLNGEYRTSEKQLTYSREFEIIFKDGCAVKFNTDAYTGRASKWRWSRRNIHGLLMQWILKIEKT